MKHTDYKKKFAGRLVIGITGGAGSGKSTISQFLMRNFETEYIHCDEVAKKMMEPGEENYRGLIAKYGESILNDDKKIDKEALVSAVKNSADGFRGLNQITHPNVVKEVLKLIQQSNKSLIVVEAALLIESGLGKYCDDVWYIYVSADERINRITVSRDWSREKTEALINNQLSDEEFRKGSTYIIENIDLSKSEERALERIKYLDCKLHN